MFLRIAKHQRIIASFLLFNFLTLFVPVQSKALSSGPAQPETQQFAPAGMDDMVDPFTGDFSYNIPLMDVGGYPINLNYAAGITPDAEASWTGLGWNLNVGAITRSVRGLPDDFSGDEMQTDFNIKPNETYGAKVNLGLSFFGAKAPFNVGLSVDGNIFYNNYNGMGLSVGVNPSISAAKSSKSNYTANLGVSLEAGSETGTDITPTLGISPRESKNSTEQGLSASIGFPFNTREGLKGMTLSAGYRPKQNGNNYSLSAFQGFSTPTYTPTIQQSHTNTSFSLGASFQLALPPTEAGNIGFTGYYSGQFLKSTSTKSPAYGYMYSGVSNSETKVYDMNREKDGTYHKKYTINLPVTNYTYDIFQVSGQGVGGSYRLYRGDFGNVSDPAATDISVDPSFSMSFGTSGETTNIGAGGAYYHTSSTSGKWSSDAAFVPDFNTETNNSAPDNEKVYFKKLGESVVENDNTFLNTVQLSTKLMQYDLFSSEYGIAKNTYLSGETVALNNVRSARPNKTTAFTTLTVAEAKAGNILPIQNYQINNFEWAGRSDRSIGTASATDGYTKTIIPRDDNARKDHHISEVRVTDQSGARYIYGIGAYNNVQKEITFAANTNNATVLQNALTSGLISYDPSQDLGNNNSNGLDNYYNCVTTPGSAHSYLLTCILSSDYVDSDNIPGPSDGDIGTYTKFNYAKLNNAFAWRTPMSQSTNVASFSDGMTGTNLDDKGNIVYGEKEVWYLHSIETPTHVAEFYVSDRLDGFGAQDQNGGIGNVALKKLDKIVLYAKADKYNSSSEPIKTVYFNYDYSLCPHTYNSKVNTELNPNQGKLTLKKIWFTYGNSQKGVLNPYAFTYADQNFDGIMDDGTTNGATNLNPDYSHLNYERWGNYNLNDINNPNALFPYVNQTNKAKADQNVSVYALSTIQTPTAGTMHVVYESDDYAYVQDKKALRMFKVAPESSTLYSGIDNQRNTINIELGEEFVPKTSDPNQEFQNAYIGDLDLMYFKARMNVINGSLLNADARYEYVPGYAEIDKSRCVPVADPDGKYRRATIGIVPVTSGVINNVNPISRAGWMYAKINLSRELKGLANAQSSGVEQIMYSMLSQLKSLATIMASFTSEMLANGHSNTLDTDKSFVRLQEPDQIKMGGGHRVKAIIMSDHWAAMKSTKENLLNTPAKQTSFYGQVYDYTTTENGKTISAGVAAYEPILGGEENPFRRPVYVVEKVPLAANTITFLEEPFGECFFPGASVGYSKVVVTPLKITATDITNRNFVGNGTGKVQQEFYTAKDFPTYTERTSIKQSSLSPNLISKFMKLGSLDLVTCTQGYYIETNDMHGKPKAKRVYPDTNGNTSTVAPQAISEVEYYYKTSNGRLDNTIPTVNPDLSIPATTSTMGVDVDVVNDQREFSTTTEGGGINLNFKLIILGIFPLFVPTGFPDVADEFVQFRSLVTTKVVNKYGILQQTIARDNGAAIATTNLAWDAKTGEVIVTSIQNEFHDPVYTFTYPAHWAYARMDQASGTEGMSFQKGYFTTNTSRFNDGDELLLDNTTTAFVNYDATSGQWDILDAAGNSKLSSFTNAKVIRSGARNMASAPVGTVVMLTNPLQGSSVAFNNVINAGASEYKETWKRMGCDCANASTSTNPYILGLKGNLRPYRSWTYLTDRYQKLVNNQMNVRTDGYYKDFAAFWQYNAPTQTLIVPSTIASTKWQYVTEITNYNSLGMEIENRDALNRYLMAQYGYGRKLPVATSNNSQYKESGFDGFEDYDYNDCTDDHMSWRNAAANVTDTESHTGRKSIKVSGGQSLEIKKVIVNCQ